MHRRPLAVAAFAAWTAYVWTNRVVNVIGDDDASAIGRFTGLAMAGTFLLLAVAVAVAWWRRSGTRGPVAVLAVWTVVVWVPRAALIVVRDHGAAFKVVHVALGVVSIALGAAAWRAVNRPAVVPSRSRARSR